MNRFDNTVQGRVLIACEESQVVAIAFRQRGIEAFSLYDIIDTKG